MKETYTKLGGSRRITFRDEERTEITIFEAGRAWIDGERFEAAPISADSFEVPDDSMLKECARRVISLAAGPLTLRRLTAFASITRHTVEYPERSWQEQHLRLFSRFENRAAGAGIDLHLGAAGIPDRSFRCIEEASAALGILGRESIKPPSLRLSPNVTAELWPWLVGAPGGTLQIGQSVHPDYPRDGSGHWIKPLPAPHGQRWPNTFRPSYRYPPVAMPLHLAASGQRTSYRSGVRAVAFLEGPSMSSGEEGATGRLSCRLLVTDGTISGGLDLALPFREWLDRITLAEGQAVWFPVGGGSWGDEAELDLG